VAHEDWRVLGCSFGELDGVFKWPTGMGVNLGGILVNWTGYLSGPLEWVRLWVQYW
jgi:hypothetical protein